MTTTELPLSRCSIEWICKHSRSPYLAKKYGHLLSSADEDVICQDQKAFVDRSSLNRECDSPTFFLRRRQSVRYSKNVNNFYNGARVFYFKANNWWPATSRNMSHVENMIVSQACDSKRFIRNSTVF